MGLLRNLASCGCNILQSQAHLVLLETRVIEHSLMFEDDQKILGGALGLLLTYVLCHMCHTYGGNLLIEYSVNSVYYIRVVY